jgi:hypothetical protein
MIDKKYGVRNMKKMKNTALFCTFLVASSVQATELCYNPKTDINPEQSLAITASFTALIEQGVKSQTISCEDLNDEKSLASAKDLVSNTATENTFWIE